MKKAITLKALFILIAVTLTLVKTSFAQCTSADAIYVTPNGTGGGTAANPANLANALLIYQGNNTRSTILMAGGDYDIYGTLSLPSGISIEGSYNDNNGVWIKNPTVNTNITINDPDFRYDTIVWYPDSFHTVGEVGILLDSVQNVVLRDFNLSMTNSYYHYAYSDKRDGYSVYGIYASQCSNVQMLNLIINTPDAENGGFGGDGAYGNYANYTQGGGLEVDVAHTTNANEPVYEVAPGSTPQTAGGAGGFGGAVQGYIACNGANCLSNGCQLQTPAPVGGNGGNGYLASGGSGGTPGQACDFNCYVNEYENEMHDPSTLTDIMSGTLPAPTPISQYGTPGTNGLDGPFGADGESVTGLPRPIEGYQTFVPGTGGAGQPGSGGGGGGGGGAGGITTVEIPSPPPGAGIAGEPISAMKNTLKTIEYFSNALGQSICGALVFNISTQGGPGGGGGEGGQGGGGGGGGGANYGIYAYLCHNMAAGNITYNLGQPGTGGQGGNGGAGGAGALGYPGPPLNGTVVFPSYRGASGGNGGNGGDGGNGQDGADGKQYQTWGMDGYNNLLVLGIDTAHICTNSIIGIIKGAQDNVSLIQFNGNIGTTFSPVSSTPTYVQYAIGSAGTYTINEENSVYTNTYQFVNFNVTNQRPLPAFSIKRVYCTYDTVLLAASDTSVDGYLWKISLNGNLLATSTAKSWKFIPPNTGAHDFYTVSLQEYSGCCGWSTPVEHNFGIEQPLTLSITESGVLPPYCAGQDSTRITLTGAPQAGIYPNYYYPGVTWTTGDTSTDHIYISASGTYYASYVSAEGCLTRSPAYTTDRIFSLPQGAPANLTIYPACAQMPVNVYPTFAGINSFTYYYSATGNSIVPGGSQVLGGFNFQPYFGYGYSTQDSVVIYDAPVSYEGCVGLSRGKVTIYHDSTGPYLQQPFTAYYHEPAGYNCMAYVNYQEPQGIDYCGGYCFSTRISGPPPGSPFPVGRSIVVYRIKNEFFDSLDVSIVIDVQDVTPPVINIYPLGGVFSARPGQCVAAYTIPAPSATDNCSGVILPTHYYNGISYGDSLWQVGTNTVYYTFTDSSHNYIQATAVITVIDNQPPVLTCPANQVYYVGPGDTAVYVGYNMPTVIDNCDTTGAGLTVTRSSGFPQFGWHPIGLTTQYFQSTDQAGNTGYCNFTIDVKDTIAPVLTCPSVYALADVGVDYTTLSYAAPTAIDNLGSPVAISLVSGKASGDTASIGLYTAVWKGTDIYGNVGTCPVHITIASNQPPVLVCPHDITTLNDSGLCTAKIDYYIAPAIDVDGHSYSPVLYSGLDSGAAFPFGTTTVVYTAVDAESNRGWCTFNVTVKDTIAPWFTTPCPNDTTLNINPAVCGAQLSPPVLSGLSYDCNPPGIGIWSGNSNHFFTLGTTLQQYRIIDEFGNYNTCSYTVNVVDNNNIAVRCPSDFSVNNDPGKCSAYIPNYGTPVVTPSYSQSCLTTTLTAPLAPNLPTFPIGTTQINYSVSVNGHNSSCSWNVTVVNTEKPHIIAPANIVQEVNNGSCGNVINFTAPLGTDTCANGVNTFMMAGLQPGSEFPVGSTLEIYVVSDLVGNTDTAKFTVTVLDTIKPVITAPADVVDATNSMCGAVESFIAPVGTDNSACVSTTLVAGLAPGSQFPLGTTKEIYVARDSAGNTDTVSFNVIVNPIYPLQSNCVDNYLQPDPTGQGQIVYYPVPGTVDQYTGQLFACPGVSIHLLSGQGSGAYFAPGPHVENYQFIVNGTGDTVNCSTNVVVTELTPPVINCGNIQRYTIAPDSGVCSARFTIPVPTTSDNGGSVTLTHTIDGVPDTSAVYTFTSGFHTIAYTAYDYFGNSAYCSIYVDVIDNFQIGNSFPAVTYCQNQSVTITPDLQGYASGLTYNWITLDSLSNYYTITTDSTLYFASIQPADYNQYHLVVTDRCGASYSGNEFPLIVTSAPATTLTGLNAGYCNYDSTDYTVIYSPAGGTLSGPGITGNKFNPKKAGPGLHTINYSYTDPNSGCTGISNVNVMVSAPPVDSLFADSVYCINAAPVQLPVTNSIYTGAGINGTVFTPANAGGGNHALTRVVTVNGCATHLTENVRINTVIPDATIHAPATVCEGTTLYPLSAVTMGGSWLGTYLVIDSLGNAKLDSHNAGPGQDTIIYTVTKNACTSSDTVVIGVNSKASNLPYTFPQYCSSGPPVAFDTTNGKQYIGVGFNNGIFYPDSVGYRGPIFYAVVTVNNFGCVDTNMRMLNLDGGQLNVYSTQYICTTHDSLFINLGAQYDSIHWADGSNSNRRWFTDTGSIQVFLRDTAGCYGYDTLHINLQPVPAQIVPATTAYACPTDSVVIFADSTFAAYKWNNGDTTSSINVLPGNYVVTVTSNYGCKYQSPQITVTTGPDVTPPTITCPPDTVLFAPAGSCSVTAINLGMASAFDNCGIASITNNAPANYAVGITQITWTAKDNSNNAGTCLQKVTINDTIKPYFTTVPAISFVVDTELNNCSTRVPDFVGLFMATDSCSGVSLTQSPLPGSFATAGVTSIAITARDLSGNTTTYYMIFQTQDTVAPVINCPADITTTISGAATTAVIHYTAPVQASNCTNSTVQRIAGLASGSAFPIGVTTQKFVVTDGAGATDTCSFNVTVNHVTGEEQNNGAGDLFSVMPIPAADHISVVYQNNASPELRIKLTSITGQVVFSDQVVPFGGNYNKTIDLKEEAAGTYLLEITSEHETVTRKVIKL